MDLLHLVAQTNKVACAYDVSQVTVGQLVLKLIKMTYLYSAKLFPLIYYGAEKQALKDA